MKVIQKHEVQIGKIYSDGMSLFFEVENYWFTNATMSGQSYNPVLVVVHKYNHNGAFEKIGMKEISFKDLKPIPEEPEYMRLIAYNSRTTMEDTNSISYSY
jgi:hypothetical protein